ncbi:MAG: alpha/beta fold hydrolase, partial [Solirubrobacteraceae bacterium]
VVHRFGPRSVALPGLLLFALACLLYRGVGATPDYLGSWLPAQIVSGTAIGLAFAGLTAASVQDLPGARLATGTAVVTCARQIGGVLGIATLIAILGTPDPATIMHHFESAWVMMSLTALGAAAFAAALPRRRGNESAAAGRPRRAIEIGGFERHEVAVCGHRLIYRTAGSGPPILFVHGLLADSTTWRRMMRVLARSHTVIAPDLFGHGESDRPHDIDYSLGGHAAVLRDLLNYLGYERTTVVGHSLGGGIAMTFAHHYPERLDRLALIAPGGFGREVHPLLRAVAVPGASRLLRMLTSRPMLAALAGSGRLLRALGARGSAGAIRGLQFTLTGLADDGARIAFVRSARAVIDRAGQGLCGLGRLELVLPVPTLLVWGTRDSVIPAEHGITVATQHEPVELVLLEDVGHIPHITNAAYVAERLATFCATTAIRPDLIVDHALDGASRVPMLPAR